MTPLERLMDRNDERDRRLTRGVGEACAANPALRCEGAVCPLWTDDQHASSRAYYRECDAYTALTGLPAVPAVPTPPRRGLCGALKP